jgi:hypothetical protein
LGSLAIAALGASIFPKKHQIDIRMGKKLSAAITSQRNEAEFFRVTGLEGEKFTAKVKDDAVQQRSAALSGGAAIRSSAKLSFDSGELLRVKIAENGEWRGRCTHCAGSKRTR